MEINIFRPPVASTLAAFGNPIPRPDAQKELWIFWYTSEEPKLVEDFKLRGLNGKYLGIKDVFNIIVIIFSRHSQ